jgi:hypothetical protein
MHTDDLYGGNILNAYCRNDYRPWSSMFTGEEYQSLIEMEGIEATSRRSFQFQRQLTSAWPDPLSQNERPQLQLHIGPS